MHLKNKCILNAFRIASLEKMHFKCILNGIATFRFRKGHYEMYQKEIAAI